MRSAEDNDTKEKYEKRKIQLTPYCTEIIEVGWKKVVVLLDKIEDTVSNLRDRTRTYIFPKEDYRKVYMLSRWCFFSCSPSLLI